MKPIFIFALLPLVSCNSNLSAKQEQSVRAIAREEAKRAIDAEVAAESRRRRAAEAALSASVERDADAAIKAAEDTMERAP